MIIAPWLEELSGLQAKLAVFLLQKAPFLLEKKTDRKRCLFRAEYLVDIFSTVNKETEPAT